MSNVRLTKKPITINGIAVGDLIHLAQYNATALPDWVRDALRTGVLTLTDFTVTVQTEEGPYTVDFRWYILQGVKGELYPCREDILWESYDKAEEQ
jgi:hypothetical protein